MCGHSYHRCKCRWSSRGREPSRGSSDDPCVETLCDRHHREKSLSDCGSECAALTWTLTWTSCHNLEEKVWSRPILSWPTWNLALEWSFSCVRVLMLPVMEMLDLINPIFALIMILKIIRTNGMNIQLRRFLRNVIAFWCSVQKKPCDTAVL